MLVCHSERSEESMWYNIIIINLNRCFGYAQHDIISIAFRLVERVIIVDTISKQLNGQTPSIWLVLKHLACCDNILYVFDNLITHINKKAHFIELILYLNFIQFNVPF